MSGPSYPDRLLRLDDWEKLPDYEQHHVEVCEGVLVASPRPGPVHEHAALALFVQLDAQLPDGLCVLGGVEVLVASEPLTVRVPDLIVVDRKLLEEDPERAPAAEIRLVVEATVEGTARTDRVTKFSEYAEAEIPQYWIVDLTGPPILAVFTLDAGWYRFDGEYTGTTALTAVGHEVTIDVDGLVTAPVDPPVGRPR
ncbi:Uma2 family endonuclease [Rhodococcus chondri]|uniref:Uma2 family endonuclease n=1 Tax=Rhodococcus chondri TaxID=3065941 RepID=A0ABU7JR47_9NOCA|nr:Uma2 family endonuclease [Rhodococcus sp. CC-R104]MEE2032508.1 Uma2 family endonuclease [Rhodococcus sp. CC-R104]